MQDKYTAFQPAAIDAAVDFLRSASPGDKRLFASPTGTGKSYMEREVQRQVPGALLIVPRVEIGLDMCQKRGLPRTVDAMQAAGIWTPIVLRNRMLAGEMPAPPALVVDEAHHAPAATYQMLDLLCGVAPAVGFTATPYRGTPKATAAFRQQWGEPVWVLTIPEAIELGVLSFPTLRVVPLVDDDKIEVRDGQFVVSAIESATGDKLGDVAAMIRPTYDAVNGCYDVPSMVSLPSRDLAARLREKLVAIDAPADVVDGDTPRAEREAAFRRCVGRQAVLVQIQVVSEGVDLPIRRLWDLHPMMSPVEFLQQFGRITRPSADVQPTYIGFNRNLLRHAYLLEGCVPVSVYAAAEAAFGGPSKRAGARAIGLEALGRFAGAEFPLASGAIGLMYAVACFDDVKAETTQYACLVDPLSAEPLWASRVNHRTDDPRKPHYGKWRRCDPPTDLAGFASLPPAPITDKQKAWWERDAKRHGLDPAAKITRKSFSVLPILADLRAKL